MPISPSSCASHLQLQPSQPTTGQEKLQSEFLLKQNECDYIAKLGYFKEDGEYWKLFAIILFI